MFKKTEIKKALATICKNKNVSEKILTQKTDAEQSDAQFVKAYSAKLYSEELMEFLNDNGVSALHEIEISNSSAVGDIASCLMDKEPVVLNAKNYNNRRERICCVGRTNGKRDFNTVYGWRTDHATYITESGEVLTTRETVYLRGDNPIMTTIAVDATVEPCFNKLTDLFPEETRALWQDDTENE